MTITSNMRDNHNQTINISTSTIFRTLLIILGLVFLYAIKDILMIVFVAILISIALNGPVNWLQKHKVPRLLGVIFIYFLIILLIALIVTLVFPPLAEQIKQLTFRFAELMEKIDWQVQKFSSTGTIQERNFKALLDGVSDKLTQATSSVFATIISVFGGLFSAIIVLVISFYLSVQEKGAKKFFISLIPTEHQHYASDLVERIQAKIGGWLRGQLLLMCIIGIMTFIVLSVLGVKYALTLALIAGLLEIVPYVGPIMSAVPAVILSFSQSPVLPLLVIIAYIAIQQTENYIIVPQVMKRTVGLNPIIIVIVMLIGAKLAGVLGIILSVPLAASLAEFFKDLRSEKI